MPVRDKRYVPEELYTLRTPGDIKTTIRLSADGYVLVLPNGETMPIGSQRPQLTGGD
jgi:hypothetical protein